MAIYHRFASDTQTLSDAVLQVRSSQIWGTVPRGVEFPCVQAYVGPLPATSNGIEFETHTPLTPASSPPGKAYWLTPQAFLVSLATQTDFGYVGIDVALRKVVYRNSRKLFNVECVFPPSSNT